MADPHPIRADELDGTNTGPTRIGPVSVDFPSQNNGVIVGNAVHCKIIGTYIEAQYDNCQNIYSRRERRAEPPTNERCGLSFFTLPFKRDETFIGREAIMTELEGKLGKPSECHTRVALTGTGGIGKTQIAIEYAYRARQALPHLSILWVFASSLARFQNSYRDIAEVLDLPGRNDSQANIFRIVYRWLSELTNGPWLMIVDNVDDDSVLNHPNTEKEPLSTWIPETANGSIIVTSRNSIAAINVIGEPDNIIEVDPMNMPEALDLFESKLPLDKFTIHAAEELVKTLEYIPLAIVQAGSYIRMRSPRISVIKYLELLHESEQNFTALLDDNTIKNTRRDYSARGSVMTTWHRSFNLIKESRPIAFDILALMSMSNGQDISETLLQRGQSTLEFEDAISSLIHHSLIIQGKTKGLFNMHRLIQLSMRKWLRSQNQLEKWLGEAAILMSEAFPSDEYSAWFVVSYYRPWESCQRIKRHH